MCSIVGIYNTHPRSNIDKNMLEKMSSLLKHRGPDNSDSIIYPHIGLAHNRLSIIDLDTRADQPFQAYRKSLVFNGFICNYKDLRKELMEHYDYHFASESDTEVVLAAYDHWGIDCFSKFNGMWAMAIYDHLEQSLLLSRDRYGIKPLYYTKDNQQFYFASEYKAFRVIPAFEYILNKTKFAEFIETGSLEYDDETLLSNINQLMPGHYIKWSNSSQDGKDLQKAYYKLKTKTIYKNIADGKEPFERFFRESISRRLIADTPISVSLSGGLDSNAILAYIPKNIRENIISFSSYDINDPRSEHREILDSSQFFNIKNHQVKVQKQSFFEGLKGLCYTQEIPVFSTSTFAQNTIYKGVHQAGYKVSLSGQGADESLMGYDLFVKNQILSHPLRFLFTPSKWYYLKKKRAKQEKLTDYLAISKYKVNHAVAKSPKELSYNLFTKSVLPSLLHFDDRNSMCWGVESRLPFLDYQLVDFIFSLEESLLLGNFERKKILRDALVKKVPDSVLKKKLKSAFYTPSESWFKDIPVEIDNDMERLYVTHRAFFKRDLKWASLAPGIKIKLYAIMLWLDLFEVKY